MSSYTCSSSTNRRSRKSTVCGYEPISDRETKPDETESSLVPRTWSNVTRKQNGGSWLLKSVTNCTPILLAQLFGNDYMLYLQYYWTYPNKFAVLFSCMDSAWCVETASFACVVSWTRQSVLVRGGVRPRTLFQATQHMDECVVV